MLYWGELAVFIGIAWLLGRWSTFAAAFLGMAAARPRTLDAVVVRVLAHGRVADRHAVARRIGSRAATFARWRFNAVQVLLAAVHACSPSSRWCSPAFAMACWRQPDMAIAGPWHYGGGTMWWFVDQTDGVIEAPSIFSVPMWVYRALFFAWASWMAFALVRWLRWAFNAWKANGLWRGKWRCSG